MTLQVARVRPERKIDLGGYDLDAIVIEYDDDADMFEFRYAYDFRFELGQGLGIYWALPIERKRPPEARACRRRGVYARRADSDRRSLDSATCLGWNGAGS
jgi:hypothetical protein